MVAINRKNEELPYISPRELSKRWQVSRSSVDRITRRAGLTKLCLGDGHRGAVRYLLMEVINYEDSRKVQMC